MSPRAPEDFDPGDGDADWDIEADLPEDASPADVAAAREALNARLRDEQAATLWDERNPE